MTILQEDSLTKASVLAGRVVHKADGVGRAALGELSRAVVRSLAQRRLARGIPAGSRVQLGCGPKHFDGWVNIDMMRSLRPDVVVDLRGGFPAPAGTVAYLYSEHVLEHLDLADGMRLLLDIRRSLQPGGVARLAMPDLGHIVGRYLDDWRDQEWLGRPECASIDTAAGMVNVALRWWGHRYVYDQNDLALRMRNAGFATVAFRSWGESPHPALEALETRKDSHLIVEGSVG